MPILLASYRLKVKWGNIANKLMRIRHLRINHRLNQHNYSTEPLTELLQTYCQLHRSEVSMNVLNIWIKISNLELHFKMSNISSKL